MDHYPTRVAVEAERAFLKELQGGCQLPVACFGQIVNGVLNLDGMVADVRGTKVVRDRARGSLREAIPLGIALAHRVLDEGGRGILEDIYKQ